MPERSATRAVPRGGGSGESPGGHPARHPPAQRESSPRARTALLVGATVLFAAALPFSIAVAQSALALAALGFLVARRPRALVPLWRPALAYAAFTLLSALGSPDRATSLADTKELLQFSILLIVPAACAVEAGLDHLLLDVFLAASGPSAAWGIGVYLTAPGDLEHRTRGPFGHYMTFAGVLMLASVAAIAQLLARRTRGRRRALLGGLLALELLALAASYTRNAWLGVAAGAAAAAWLLRRRLLPAVVLLLALAALAAPAGVRARAASIFSLEQNVDRLEMLEVGLAMVHDRPLDGVGPNMVPRAWGDYTSARTQPHLHDNVLQIAAERGLGALAAWLWFVAEATTLTLRAARRRPGDAAPAMGFAAIAALLVAGLFEYNFGNAVVKMTFLFVLCLAVSERGDAAGTVSPRHD